MVIVHSKIDATQEIDKELLDKGSNQVVESRGPERSLVLHSITPLISMTSPLPKRRTIGTAKSTNSELSFPPVLRTLVSPVPSLPHTEFVIGN